MIRQVKSERAADVLEMQRLRASEAQLKQEIELRQANSFRPVPFVLCVADSISVSPCKLQAEDDATAEERRTAEIFRSKLERALEEELIVCRRQLEQMHRDFQAEIETSARLKQENMALQAVTCVSAYSMFAWCTLL